MNKALKLRKARIIMKIIMTHMYKSELTFVIFIHFCNYTLHGP